MADELLATLISRWRDDPCGTYRTWFLWEERLKNFRSIRRGIAVGAPDHAVRGLFLVAPDQREDDVRAQLKRPAFRHVATLGVRYLPYSELSKHREAIARFGEGMKGILAVSRSID